MDPFEQLVEALNNLTRETGHQALAITFNRSDTPIDWNDDIGGWEVVNGE